MVIDSANELRCIFRLLHCIRLRIFQRACLALCLCYVVAMPATTAQCADPDFVRSLERQYDEILLVDVQSVPKFLQYNKSTLQPMHRMNVTVRKTGASLLLRGMQPPLYKAQVYEELWYHIGKAYGMRRYSTLQIPEEQAAIYFHSEEMQGISNHIDAAANCVVRLLLDIVVSRGTLAAVLVPEECIDPLSNSLRQFNFVSLDQSPPGSAGAITLRLISYSGPTVRFLCRSP